MVDAAAGPPPRAECGRGTRDTGLFMAGEWSGPDESGVYGVYGSMERSRGVSRAGLFHGAQWTGHRRLISARLNSPAVLCVPSVVWAPSGEERGTDGEFINQGRANKPVRLPGWTGRQIARAEVELAILTETVFRHI